MIEQLQGLASMQRSRTQIVSDPVPTASSLDRARPASHVHLVAQHVSGFLVQLVRMLVEEGEVTLIG